MPPDRYDLHIHSTYSDGSASIHQIAERAKNLGLHTIAIADHFGNTFGSRMIGLRGINERRKIIKDMDRAVREVRILEAAEVDISPDGSLVPVEGGFQQFELVIGSLHWMSDSSRWASAVLGVLKKNPQFHVLGHWNGYMRSYRHEDGIKVAEALADNDVAVELNSRYRIEHVEFLEAARDFGCMFTLGSDAHWVDAIGKTKAQAELAAALNLPLLEIP